jgi:hypothetical protein
MFDYCENTSLHGMKYIAQRDRRWYERWVFVSRTERFVCPEFQKNKWSYSRQEVLARSKLRILVYRRLFSRQMNMFSIYLLYFTKYNKTLHTCN